MDKISSVFSDKLKENGISSECAEKLASALDFQKDDSHDEDRQEELSERDLRDLAIAARALSSVIIRRSDEPSEVYSSLESADPTRPSLHQNERIVKLSDSTKKMPEILRRFISYAVPFLSYAAMVFLSIAAACLIILGIFLMIAATVAGILLFIVGILYGVSQLGVFRAAGIYEIGFGTVLGGVSALITVLLYNAVLRGIPFTLKKAFMSLRGVIRDFAGFRRMLHLNK